MNYREAYRELEVELQRLGMDDYFVYTVETHPLGWITLIKGADKTEKMYCDNWEKILSTLKKIKVLHNEEVQLSCLNNERPTVNNNWPEDCMSSKNIDGDNILTLKLNFGKIHIPQTFEELTMEMQISLDIKVAYREDDDYPVY